MHLRHLDSPMLSTLAIIAVVSAIMVALMAWQEAEAPYLAPTINTIGTTSAASACFVVPTRQMFLAGLSGPAVREQPPPATVQ